MQRDCSSIQPWDFVCSFKPLDESRKVGLLGARDGDIVRKYAPCTPRAEARGTGSSVRLESLAEARNQGCINFIIHILLHLHLALYGGR